MSKHDLRARPIYHHKRESIEAHLNVVLAVLAVTHHVETTTDWPIKQLVRTARPHRPLQIRARPGPRPEGQNTSWPPPPPRSRPAQTRPGPQTLTAEDPLPDDLRDAPAQIC